MRDDLVKRLRKGAYSEKVMSSDEAADRIEALEADVSRAAQQTDEAVAVVVEEIADFCEDATPSPEWGDDTKSTYRFAGKDIARCVRKIAPDDAAAALKARDSRTKQIERNRCASQIEQMAKQLDLEGMRQEMRYYLECAAALRNSD